MTDGELRGRERAAAILSEATDEQLVARFVAGEAAAFDALVARHSARVYAICLRYFGNPADAEDAAQDAFVLLLRRAETFAGNAKFSTWMYRVATNACNDLARKRSRRPRTVALETDQQVGTDAAADEPFLARQLGPEMASALRELDHDQREAVLAHDVHGVPYAEIAERTGVALGTVKSRIHRGHARLAELLDQRSASIGDGEEPKPPSRPPTKRS